jgi:hypothetical protein
MLAMLFVTAWFGFHLISVDSPRIGLVIGDLALGVIALQGALQTSFFAVHLEPHQIRIGDWTGISRRMTYSSVEHVLMFPNRMVVTFADSSQSTWYGVLLQSRNHGIRVQSHQG